MATRRKFSPELKAQIVLEILKEEKSISQLSSEHGIHPVQLSKWKREAVQNLYYASEPLKPQSIQPLLQAGPSLSGGDSPQAPEIYTQYPFFGSRRITAMLHREGKSVHRNTVRKYMQEMGLAAIYPGPNLSKRNQEHRIYP